MTKLSRGITYLFTLTVVFVILSAVGFYFGMAYLEHRPVTPFQALEFVVQTMTTVGYGQHAPWQTALMNLLVIVTEIAGIAIVFMSIPIVVTPWIQERITLQPPTEYDGPGDHIIITEYTDLMDTLLDELEERDIPYVLIDDDQETASELIREDRNVILGDASEPDTLKEAHINEARLAILDGEDEHSAMVALAMGEFDHDIDVMAVATHTNRGTHLSQAGADKVIYPRELIGRELARHALKTVGKAFDINDKLLKNTLDIREFPILPTTSLLGESLQSADIRSRFGINIIAIWRRGNFINHPSGDFLFRKGDILVATGTPDQLDRFEQETEISKSTTDPDDRNIVIIGFGNEGEAARARLRDDEFEPTVLNDIDKEHVDVVGNGMDEDALDEANVRDADTVIICISRDDVAVMVTLMVRRLNPRAEILVQVNQEYAIEPIYRAGANYVESLNLITSRMLAGEALGEDLISPELNIKIRHCGVGDLAGKSLKDIDATEQHQVTILAVKRDENIISDPNPQVKLREGDSIYICGTDDNVDQFAEESYLTDPDE
jgi:Trk K+ transport system NAD-binding subunit